MQKFTIFFATIVMMASCTQDIIDPIEPLTEHIHYNYDVIVDISDDPVFNDTEEITCSIDNPKYPDTDFTLNFSALYSSSSIDGAGKFIINTDGYFTINTTITSIGGYTDTIYGSGYFDTDTLYFEYTYKDINSNNIGYITGHSY